MSTHQKAPTKYVEANGTRLAYRLISLSNNNDRIPLVMLMHFRGNMDFWDPLLINTLSKSRPILLLDNAGIGRSSGLIPTSLHGWAAHVLELLKALQISRIDLLGFSMGGGAAQCVALAAPSDMVRKLIIAGSRTSFNPTMVIGDRAIFHPLARNVSESDFKEAWTTSFFPHTAKGHATAAEVWTRIQQRSENRATHLDPERAQRQTEAFTRFSQPGDDRNPYERLMKEGKDRVLNMPVLVANGDDDLLIPTINSVSLVKMLVDARLKIYENSGHGFLFQYAERFAADVDEFLDGGEKECEGLENLRAKLS